ncbi:MAG: hypothetical protein GQ470_03050 [Gammaproteobacteria bacterium]|nr:hypothetical protein [Gammaproteobacteria bacterium]
MEPQQLKYLMEITIESGVAILIIFSIIAFGVGVMLFFAPQKLEHFRNVSDRWVTPRKRLKPLDIPRDGDTFLYRNYRWVGSIAMVLPILTIYLLLYSVADQLPHSSVSIQKHYLFWQWLFESSIMFLWVSSIFSLIIGVAIFFRPSSLKGFEDVCNRWLSTRQALRRFDRSYSKLDELMMQRARWTAIFLILGSIYVLVMMLTFVLNQPGWLDLLVNQVYISK